MANIDAVVATQTLLQSTNAVRDKTASRDRSTEDARRQMLETSDALATHSAQQLAQLRTFELCIEAAFDSVRARPSIESFVDWKKEEI